MNKAILNKIFRTALIGADPKKCILESIRLENNHIKIENDSYDLNKINKIFIISFGKSSIPMSEAISKILKDKIYRGLVISNDIPKNKIKRFGYINPHILYQIKIAYKLEKKLLNFLTAQSLMI